MVLLVPIHAYASTDNIPEGMGEKAVRGAINLVTGIVEIPMQTYKGYTNGFAGIAELPAQTVKGARDGNVLVGLGKGFWFWQSRQWYGFTDIFSSLGANPVDNPGYPFNGVYPWSALTDSAA